MIRKAGVIGAGVMGSGIAAHLANGGLEVVLLDMDKAFAVQGIEKQVKAEGFVDPAYAARVTPGSTGDDLHLLADADWIIEAVSERLDIKQTLYRAVDGVRKPGSIVSSNTSTIPLATLTGGMPDGFGRDFLIAHFFNPPRHMRLLELVGGAETRPEALEAVRRLADAQLGKAVVDCKDTPGFIGNRIGCYWILVAMNEAIARGLDVEEADAVIGKPFGIPATGVFGLVDLIGIDLIVAILRSLQGALPATDAVQAYPAEPALLTRMIAEKRLGRKSGAGFVKLSADRKSREVTDLSSGDYRAQRPAASESLDASRGKAKALMEHAGAGGQYAAAVMEKTLAYVASLVPEITDTVDAVDEAMRTGYGWKTGPFEMIDQLGAGWLAQRLAASGIAVPELLALAAGKGGFYTVENGRRMALGPDGVYRPVAIADGVLTIAALALAKAPAWQGSAANLWDLGEGVAALELRTKMNTFSEALLSEVEEVVERVPRDFRALVIGSDSPVFSAGADLRTFLETLEKGGPAALATFIDRGHAAFGRLKYAPFPVVGAAAGLAFGGGCEVLLHCDAIQGGIELQMGLVEPRIGLIPGWGGCKEMLARFAAAGEAPLSATLSAFGLIAPARVSKSAADAKKLGFLRSGDGITMNRDRLLGDARRAALALAEGYAPPQAPLLALPGAAGIAAIREKLDAEAEAGRLTAHDRVVGEALAVVLSGGADADPSRPVTEDAVLALEKAAFVELLGTQATLARVKHMLETGKPLRN